eukprot:Gb_01605 [translate_table: standard]
MAGSSFILKELVSRDADYENTVLTSSLKVAVKEVSNTMGSGLILPWTDRRAVQGQGFDPWKREEMNSHDECSDGNASPVGRLLASPVVNGVYCPVGFRHPLNPFYNKLMSSRSILGCSHYGVIHAS